MYCKATSLGRAAHFSAANTFQFRAGAALTVAALTLIAPARAGDFNGDGIDDLALGAPGDTVAGAVGAGSVSIVFGRGLGFGLDNVAPLAPGLLTEIMFGSASAAGDAFGHSLAIGDFNNDGFDDLAIGAPYDNSGAGVGEGLVIVVYGSPAGLNGAGAPPATRITRASLLALAGVASEFFGFALAAGDFDCDGFSDLAIGVANHDEPGLLDCGSVCVTHGGVGGLLGGGFEFLQSLMGDPCEVGDHFGDALTVGNFNCDCADDLAIGASGENFAAVDEGAVNAIYGLSGLGLLPAAVLGHPAAQFWHQGLLGGGAALGDHFARALASGDFNNDGAMDLAVGIAGRDIGGNVDTGQVTVIHGGCANGLQVAAPIYQRWHQDSLNVPDINEPGDLFGSALVSGDFDNNGLDDLAIGQMGEDRPGGVNQSGAVTVLYGDPVVGWLVAPGGGPFVSTIWEQNTAGIPGVNALNDMQGAALAAGDFDDDAIDDLVFGVPGEDSGAVVNAGCVNTVYGSPGGLTVLAPVAPEIWLGSMLPLGLNAGDALGLSAASNR